MSMSRLNRRLQVLLDEERYDRLEREAARRGSPVVTVVREAVDRLLAEETDRRAAGDRLLAAPPMQVDDWSEMKSVDTIDARLSRGRYTIIAAAATPPLSISHVSRVLRGISRSSLDVAQRIADAAGIPLTDLQAFLRERQASPLAPLMGKRPQGPSAKFNNDTAREIRARAAEGDTIAELAAEYGASRQAINEIVRGVSYPPS